MASLKKYNLVGEELGEVSLSNEWTHKEVNPQLIKDYLVALRTNARQWSAHTKTRAEVSHSGQKPHPQKGTGRARQGYLGSPQYKGGGRVFSPRAKFDQHVRINKKERRAAIAHLLGEKVVSHRVHVLAFEEQGIPKTQAVARFLRALQLEGGRVLFLAEPSEGKYDNWSKSVRNIPRIAQGLVSNINGYDVALSGDIVLMDGAVEEFMTLLMGGK